VALLQLLVLDLHRVALNPDVLGHAVRAAIVYAQLSVLSWLEEVQPADTRRVAGEARKDLLADTIAAANCPEPAVEALKEPCERVAARHLQTAFWMCADVPLPSPAKVTAGDGVGKGGVWMKTFASTSYAKVLADIVEVLGNPQIKTARVLADPLQQAFWVLCAGPHTWGVFKVRISRQPVPPVAVTVTVEYCQGDRVFSFHFRDMIEQKILHNTWVRVEHRRPVGPVPPTPHVWDDAADARNSVLYAKCTATDAPTLGKALTETLGVTTAVTSLKMRALLGEILARGSGPECSETVQFLCRVLLSDRESTFGKGSKARLNFVVAPEPVQTHDAVLSGFCRSLSL
jgi:hypothetical protein